AGRTAQHLLGLDAHGVNDLAAADVAERHDGGLVQNDALTLHIDERIGGAEIDGDVVGDSAEEGRKHAGPWGWRADWRGMRSPGCQRFVSNLETSCGVSLRLQDRWSVCPAIGFISRLNDERVVSRRTR